MVDKTKTIEEIPEWFKGARLNYAENMLRYNDDRVALYAAGKLASPSNGIILCRLPISSLKPTYRYSTNWYFHTLLQYFCCVIRSNAEFVMLCVIELLS